MALYDMARQGKAWHSAWITAQKRDGLRTMIPQKHGNGTAWSTYLCIRVKQLTPARKKEDSGINMASSKHFAK